jgi:2-amino-4-hydroxy-6-hydroxymethyldihydropteridine diphosphokinase
VAFGRQEGNDLKKAYVGLGSNLGEREYLIRSAAEGLDLIPMTKLVRISSLYDTKPIGELEQPDYLNAVALVTTGLDPSRLLWNLHLIENKLGRRRNVRWEPRPIDLDLLFFEDAVIDEEGIKVPHPEAHKRAFVLVPMNELSPDYVHPVLKKSIEELLGAAEPRGSVKRKGRFWQ